MANNLIGDRYVLGPLLGRGGMAEVRRAHDTRLDRDVAVKRLRADLAGDPIFQERFRREAHAAAGLNHPNIVSVFDTGDSLDEASGVMVPYIVMELVIGHTLREILHDGRKVQPVLALEMTSSILDALDYSHRHGIVHRDIKPANVMVTSSGQVKVMDFGIARAVSDTAASMTQTASVIGTPQYLSPEQIRGEQVDRRSDIYSTGCLLYELLTGKPPFEGDSPVSLAYQHVRATPVPPSENDPLVSTQMDAITLKALAKSPSDRYQTAHAMQEDIQRLLSGQKVLAEIPPPATDDDIATQVISSSPATQTLQQTKVTPLAERAVLEPTTEDDEEEKSGVGKIIAIALAAVLVVAIITVVLVRIFSTEDVTPPVDSTTGLVTVPSVMGLTEENATNSLEEREFDVTVEYEIGPNDESLGKVIDQNPVKESLVPLGSTVTITVNSGPETFKMPNVVGMDKDAALAELEAQGYTNVVPEISPHEDPATTINEVVSTNPAADTDVTKDQLITVYYSDGGTMPDVRGKNWSDAEKELKQAGYTNVRSVAQNDNPTAMVNQVVSTSPATGTPITHDQEIVLYYDSGMATVPNVMTLSLSVAEAQLKAAGFSSTSTETGEAAETADKVGTVIAQSPAPGDLAAKDTRVKLTLAGPVPTAPTTPTGGG